MTDSNGESVEAVFAEYYDWRRKHQLARYQELYHDGIIGPTGVAARTFGKTVAFDEDRLVVTAYRRTILYLWGDVQESYIYGRFLACILACGALAERCLKLDYIEKVGALPNGRWMLGKLVYSQETNTVIEGRLVDLARDLLSPRNRMAHAILEHEDPELAIQGGQATRTPVVGEHYIIQPYRGDALEVLKTAAEIMLYQFADSTSSDE